MSPQVGDLVVTKTRLIGNYRLAQEGSTTPRLVPPGTPCTVHACHGAEFTLLGRTRTGEDVTILNVHRSAFEVVEL